MEGSEDILRGLEVASGPPPVVPPEGASREAFTLAYLAEHEGECPACGYNVHALVAARCPECGRALEVRVVGAVGGFSAAWVTALVVEALAAGVGVFVLLVEINEGMRSIRHFWDEPLLSTALLYFLANIPVPLVLLGVRRWYVRWNNALQWVLMLMAGVATVLMLGLFISQIVR